jgi:hypothetical protein
MARNWRPKDASSESSSSDDQTKTVTLEVTFAPSHPSATLMTEIHRDDDDVHFLRNIELCHLADWQVQHCTAVLGKEPQRTTHANKPPSKKGSCYKCCQCMFLTCTHFAVFILAFLMGGLPCSLPVHSQQKRVPKPKSVRLPPSTSLVRVEEPLPSYSEGWIPVPPEYAKTYYADRMKQSHPFLRALHEKGYFRVEEFEKAHVLYTHDANADWAKELEPWQRFNYIPGKSQWKNAYTFHYQYKKWERQTGRSPASVYIPETYLLTHYNKTNAKKRGSKDFDGEAISGGKSKYDYNTQLVKEDIKLFQIKLMEDDPNMKTEVIDQDQNQIDRVVSQTFWLVKTDVRREAHRVFAQANDYRDLKRLASDNMKYLLDQGQDDNIADSDDDKSSAADGAKVAAQPSPQTSRSFIQKYICDRIVMDSRYTFTIRAFWAVVSLEPLIVMYHDGYITGYGSDVTTPPSSSDEGYRIKTGKNWDTRPLSFEMSFSEFETALDKSVPHSFPAGTPTQHIRSQMKEALADMVQIFQTKSFKHPDGVLLTAENAYSLFCVDFLLDQSLDIWLLSPKSGCNLDEDYYFRLDLHASMFEGMVTILEQVWEKQEKKKLVMPLQKKGHWEMLYGDGLRFYYDGYDPTNRTSANKRDCLGVSYVTR